MGQYTMLALGVMLGLFILGGVLYAVRWSIPVLTPTIWFAAAALAGARYSIIWLRGLSPACLIDGLGLRESTNRFSPFHATTSEDEEVSGFPATIALNVGGYRVPGLSGPGHNIIEGPAMAFEKLSEKLAIFYIAAVPVPDDSKGGYVYSGYSSVARDISMKSPLSSYVPGHGRVWVGILDSRTKEASQRNMRAFDGILTDFGTMMHEDRTTIRLGLDGKIDALKARARKLRKRSVSEHVFGFFKPPPEARVQVAYKELEESRKE